MTKVKLTIDDQELEVEQGTNLIEAAAKLNITVPHYCYHAGLRPDGNCRMCLVEMEKAPKPVPACMTGAGEGMVIRTKTPEIEKIRANVMEFLLINHPLDCPTCDQAGECRLQDYYMDYDRIPSRYEEEKVHKDKMVNLGSNVMLDEERCIVCTRCVRFCQDVAQNEELYVQARGNHSMVATFPGKELTNPYAGNTVDICPVGALTNKDFRYKKRVWYLTYTDSICPGCSRGCNISAHHEDRKVYRLKPRYNAEVNKHWMCDAGRFDYKFINKNRRLKPAFRMADGLESSSQEDALSRLLDQLKTFNPDQIAFVASAQESNQEIDAFVQFAKSFGSEVYASKNDPENPFEDEILIKADKNANSAHIQKLGLADFSNVKDTVKAIFVQRNLSPTHKALVESKNIKVIALFATNETGLDALTETVFPIPSYVEQSGTFTNFEGKEQKFSKAFDPRGESQLVQHHLTDLEKGLSELKKAS